MMNTSLTSFCILQLKSPRRSKKSRSALWEARGGANGALGWTPEQGIQGGALVARYFATVQATRELQHAAPGRRRN
jgi:hypothetical protein